MEEIDGKWLYWGRVLVEEQTIADGRTSGTYRIIKLYWPDFQRRMTIEESPVGKCYFPETRTSMTVPP